ncbi:hypothetical protein [Runella zeae]|nr:hypothetical protein [Runella zeae]
MSNQKSIQKIVTEKVPDGNTLDEKTRNWGKRAFDKLIKKQKKRATKK